MAVAQNSASEIDAHITVAKAAAGLEYRATFVNLCFPTPLPGGPRGAAALLMPRPAPERGIWYASPYQVFDNLYWLGTRQHSSWTLKTSAGLIIIDTNFAWATEPEILNGLAKLKLDARDIKYVILSHAHGDHDQGVATLQSKFGAKVVMGGPDWDTTLQRAPDVAGGVPKRGPGDIAVGPEGTRVTLGDTAVDVIFTPGHSPGTLSYVFPVKDKGKTVMVAYSGGTLTGAFGADGKRWDEYIDSQKRIAQAASAAGASVILSNHSEYDNAYTKARLVAVKREVGEANPFISTPQSVQDYFTVMEECATASKLRNAAK
ncbi:MAG: MBL fold metallo-hydrolase [Alphaproteobacteria bacterium]|nr:MBL fold metallo-hydrolase [Alphaproteobacteria bacterium]